MRPAEVKIGGPNRATATKAVRSRRGSGTKVGPVVSFEMKDRFRPEAVLCLSDLPFRKRPLAM